MRLSQNLFLIFIIFLNIDQVSAQSNFRDGYIINLKNDTVFGKINYKVNSKLYTACQFRLNDEITEYGPYQLMGFGFTDDKSFTTQILKGIFVEILVLGDLSLYRHGFTYYIKRKGEEFHVLEEKKIQVEVDGKSEIRSDNQWKRILNYLISDCDKNKVVTEQLRIGEKSLTKIIVQYNQCKGVDYSEFKKKKDWVKIKLGAILSITQTSLKLRDRKSEFEHLNEKYTSVDPSFGLLLNVASPRITERLAFQPEIHFTKSSFHSRHSSKESSVRTTSQNTSIELSTISIPLGLKYSLPMNKSSLSFSFGGLLDFHIKSEAKVKRETIYYNSIFRSERDAFHIKNGQQGLWGGLEYMKKFKKFSAGLQLRYTKTTRLNFASPLIVNLDRLSISLIIYR